MLHDPPIPPVATLEPRRARTPPDGNGGRLRAPTVGAIALVGVAYFAVAKLGLSFSQGHDVVSAVWPPSGLALAAAIVYGPRVAPAIFLAAVLSNATGDSSVPAAAGIATGNALAAVTGAWLLARAGFDPGLRRVRDVAALAILGAAASTAVNATIGTATLLAAGVAHPHSLWAFWRVWWLGDLTGVLLVAPPLLLVAAGGGARLPAARRRTWVAEASLLAAALVAVMLIVLHQGVTLAFPIFPLIVLAAMRFRQAGAVVAALVVSTVAVAYTAHGHGPFAGGAPDLDLLSAQVFVGLAAFTGLLVAAMRSEWERAEDALARLEESERALEEAQRVAQHQALHDALTGLPNRALFLDRLQHALARARRPGSSLAVYFCDVDDFKHVNDSLGHEAGDELLVALPPRLREALRASDTIARFGGDELVILCEDLGSEAEAIRIAERIAEACRLPFELDGRPHHLSVSVGVVFARGGEASAADVLRDADAAMYRAKSAGKGGFELYDADMRAALVARLQTESDLHRAIEDGELRLLYQPVLALAEDAFVGAEALVRWQHPERGLLPPAAFIGVAEESGLIASLGAWVLEEACRQAAMWGAGRTVSVNLSPRQLSRSDVPGLLLGALERTGADPAQLELEITENVLMEQSAGALATLRRLKQMGVRLVLDDFGTGWSSLSYLKRFPLDGLKIDREFVDGLGTESEDTAIVAAVLSMAHALELETVAEGVETEAQLAWLRERRCAFAQGYLLGRPMPAAELEADARWRGGGGAA